MKTRIMFAVLLTVGLATPALAMEHFKARLSASQESKPTGSAATGHGLANLADDGHNLSVILDWKGLSANAAAGHIHCCSATGVDSGVAIMLEPAATKSGRMSIVTDLDLDASYVPAFLAANGGTAATAKAALLTAMKDGMAYFNIHTANHPNGEIRGNISGKVKMVKH